MSAETQGIKNSLGEYLSLCEQAIKAIMALQEQDWSIESLRDFFMQRNVVFNDAQYSQYETNIASIQSFDFEELLRKIDEAFSFGKRLNDNNADWGNYNDPFMDHVATKIEGTITQIQSFNTMWIAQQRTTQAQNYLNSILTALNNLNSSINPNLDELFEHFKYGNKNYVIFGKNGSGKTTLLRKIAADILRDNSVIIPADRTVKPILGTYRNINTALTYNQKLSDSIAMDYLLLDLQTAENQNYRAGVSQSESVYEKFRGVFNNLGLEREISTKDFNAFLSVITKEATPYPLADGSDGERTAVYMILAVLMAPDNSFIFIDEPENHLNGLLMRNLFDDLERARPDARFIYLTHKTEFIESRTNIELIYLEKTDIYNEWRFKKLSDYEHIDIDILLDIEGSQNDIIFCEGDGISSIDSKILCTIFPEYTIKSVISCGNVKNNTIAINAAQGLFRRKAFGIVDGDFQIDEEKATLRDCGVLVLEYNEWENLLLDIDILTVINRVIGINSIDDVKEKIVDIIRQRKNNILSDFLNKRFSRIISNNKLAYSSELSNAIDSTNGENKLQILSEVKKLSVQLDEFIQNSDYNNLLGVVPGKMIINEAAIQIGLRNKETYIEKVLTMARGNTDFCNLLRSKTKLESLTVHTPEQTIASDAK